MSLQDKMDAGNFIVLAEMEPPKGTDLSSMIANATKVKGVVDAFVVPEMSNAVMRMSSLGGAMILQNKGLETIMQVCCRDRNRLAIQADLLAANGCKIRNIMAVTGEDPSFGDHHQAAAVYDIDLAELFQCVQSMQNGKDMAGTDLQGSPSFLMGSTINPGLKDAALELEIEEMEKKIAAGVKFFITTPVFDLEIVKPFLERIDQEKTKIIPTILLLKSLGMARYMARNMPHVHLTDDLVKRIQNAGDKVRECIIIAQEMTKALKQQGFSGVMLSTIGWEDRLPDVLGTTVG